MGEDIEGPSEILDMMDDMINSTRNFNGEIVEFIDKLEKEEISSKNKKINISKYIENYLKKKEKREKKRIKKILKEILIEWGIYFCFFFILCIICCSIIDY